MSNRKAKKKKKVILPDEIVTAEHKAELDEIREQASKNVKTVRRQRVFRPMAGFWLLHVAAFIFMIIVLKPSEYDTLLERAFWGFIAFNLSLGIIRHWPAVQALLKKRKV